MSAKKKAKPTGASHELTTLDDVMRLYRALPPQRAEVMLTEIGQAIRYGAGLFELAGLAGCEVKTMPMTWIDDDLGEKTVHLHADETSGALVSMKVGR